MFYDRFIELCNKNGVKPTRVAIDIGFNKAVVTAWKTKWQNGQDVEPSSAILKKLSDYFGVSVDYLLGNGVKVQEVAITGMVAVFGRIPAGFPAFAVENIEGWVPTTLKHPEEHFCLIVHGTSMTGAGIVDGCKVILHRQSTAENGQIVACRVNGDEATLKRFKQIGDVIMLMPENSEFDPIPLTSDDFKTGKAEILGVLKQVIIDY